MESQQSWEKYCLDMLVKKMQGDRYGKIFATPVTEASDSVIPPAIKENYKLTIPKPMDYKTIKNNLNNHIYQSPHEFHGDMMLIYDNCMKFNPPVGNSKWLHDAAKANLKKYNKLWDQYKQSVISLFNRKLDPVTVPSTQESAAPSTGIATLKGDGDLNTESVEKPRSTFTFRLSLQSIQEYKLRRGFNNQLPQDMTPVETEAVAHELEDVDDETGTVLDKTDVPSIMSREEDGVLCVSWLSANECNRLFPNCSIIGIGEERPNYNLSDVAIRYIYNQLYLNDVTAIAKQDNAVKNQEKLDDTTRVDHSMHQHNRINFIFSKRDSKYNNPNLLDDGFVTPPLKRRQDTILSEEDICGSNDSIHSILCDDKVPMDYGRSDVCNSAFLSSPIPYGPRPRYSTKIELSMESTVGIDSDTETVLKKNDFTRVCNVDEFSKISCEPPISLLSTNFGFFKIDESEFVHKNNYLKHIRLFLVNCAKVTVEISKDALPLSRLVLNGKASGSCVKMLQHEAKIGNLRNLPFFELPSASNICYCEDLDILWRSQVINNALPTPLLALHLICDGKC